MHILIATILVFLFGFPVYAERPINEIPMYGGQHLPSVERNTEFSRAATQRAWKAYYQGDLDTAIKRFNQGWMFDQDNPEVFWGFGLISGQHAFREEFEKNLEASIMYLHIAKNKAPDNGKIIGDLAYSHTLLGQYLQSEKGKEKESQEHFRIAGNLFVDAIAKEPDYPPVVANFSVFYFYTKKFTEAKLKAEAAIKLGYEFDPNYIKALEQSK
jgi:tetratricopeptide (TPR) repeat protein